MGLLRIWKQVQLSSSKMPPIKPDENCLCGQLWVLGQHNVCVINQKLCERRLTRCWNAWDAYKQMLWGQCSGCRHFWAVDNMFIGWTYSFSFLTRTCDNALASASIVKFLQTVEMMWKLWVIVLLHPILLPSFPFPSLNVNVLITLQNSQSNPLSPRAPTSYLKELCITPHGASPTVSSPTWLTWSTKPSTFRQA